MNRIHIVLTVTKIAGTTPHLVGAQLHAAPAEKDIYPAVDGLIDK